MLKKIVSIAIMWVALHLAVMPGYAASIIVDARAAVVVEPPSVGSWFDCSMVPAPSQPSVTLLKGTVAAISFPAPLPIELFQGYFCQKNPNRPKEREYKFTYNIKNLWGVPLAQVETTVYTSFKVIGGMRRFASLHYDNKVTRYQNDENITIEVGCNSAYDKNCAIQNSDLPNEYQHDISDQSAWKYFPFSVVVRIQEAAE